MTPYATIMQILIRDLNQLRFMAADNDCRTAIAKRATKVVSTNFAGNEELVSLQAEVVKAWNDSTNPSENAE